jgi:predicted RNA methylase
MQIACRIVYSVGMATESLEQIEFILKASQADPTNVDFQLQADSILSKFLPHWHIPMVHDHARNDFYENMIKREVQDKTVLDIGTGTGFLALLAAKYGAKHVYACEMNPLFFNIAKQNIERSGFKDRISLSFGSSKKLKLPEKVDLLVSEIISTSIFSENMLVTLKNAKRLMKKDAQFLPRKIEVHANLVRFKSFPEESSRHEIFDSLIDYGRKVPGIHNFNYDEIEILSDSVLLTTIDEGFVLSENFPIRFQLDQKVKTTGARLCVYFKILDGEDYISNFDFGESSKHFANSWGLMTWPLSRENKRDFELHLGEDQRLVLV